MSEKPTIGFIGVGFMGHGMASNILKNGYPLIIKGNQNRAPIDDLVRKGAVEADSISRLVKSYNNEGFPAFTEPNQSNKDLTNILVGPFASMRDIEDNKQKLNNIAKINTGEVIAWNP